MRQLHEVDIPALVEIYMLANTPTYLYRRFRQNESVQSLASRMSAEDLYNSYRDLASSTDRSLEGVVLAYACVVAMTFKRLGTVRPLLEALDSYGLDWIDAIRRLYFSTARANEYIHLRLAPGKIQLRPQRFVTTSSSTSLKITYRAPRDYIGAA